MLPCLDGVHRTTIHTRPASTAGVIVDHGNELGGMQQLGSSGLDPHVENAAVGAAIADEMVGIVGMYQALFIGSVYDVDGFFTSYDTTHTMFGTPQNHVSQEETGF
jgi:hypothetical protein